MSPKIAHWNLEGNVTSKVMASGTLSCWWWAWWPRVELP